MESILIVSSRSQSIDGLTKLLMEEELMLPESVSSAAEAKKAALEKAYDLILVDSPLSDAPSDETAAVLARSTDSCVMLFAAKEAEKQLEKKMWEEGVFIAAKPVSRYMFHKTITYLRACYYKLNGIKREKDKLRKQNEEIRLINRAKGILMEYLSMTEPQAHKYLEKQAMDLRITKAEAAKRLLSTYEN